MCCAHSVLPDKLHGLLEILVAIVQSRVDPPHHLLNTRWLLVMFILSHAFSYPTDIVNTTAEPHDAVAHCDRFPVPVAGTKHTPSVERFNTSLQSLHRTIMIAYSFLQDLQGLLLGVAISHPIAHLLFSTGHHIDSVLK